jgi:hypothetical protein
LSKIRYSLFDYVVGFCDNVPFVGAFFVKVGDYFCYAQRGGMEGCLWDEAVGEGDSEEAGDTCGEAEEEEVPVEAGGFTEGKFCALGY